MAPTPAPFYQLVDGKAPVKIGDEIQLLPPEQANELIRAGRATPVPHTEMSAKSWKENYTDEVYTPGKAAILGALRGATFGATDAILSGLGGEAGATLGRRLREENPGASLAGELVGGAASAFIPGAPVAALGRAGAAVGGRVGTAVGRGLAGLGEAAGPVGLGAARAGRVAELAARGVTEGAGFGLGSGVSAVALQKEPRTAGGVAETLVEHLAGGAAFGGGLNLLGGAVAGTVKWGINKAGFGQRAKSALAERDAAQAGLEMAKEQAGPRQVEARTLAERLEKKALDERAEVQALLDAASATKQEEGAALAAKLQPMLAEEGARAAEMAEIKAMAAQRLAAGKAASKGFVEPGVNLDQIYPAAEREVERITALKAVAEAAEAEGKEIEKRLLTADRLSQLRADKRAAEAKLKQLEEARGDTGAATPENADTILRTNAERAGKAADAVLEAKQNLQRAKEAAKVANEQASADLARLPKVDAPQEEIAAILFRRPDLGDLNPSSRWADLAEAVRAHPAGKQHLAALGAADALVSKKPFPVGGVGKLVKAIEGEKAAFNPKQWIQHIDTLGARFGLAPLDADASALLQAQVRLRGGYSKPGAKELGEAQLRTAAKLKAEEAAAAVTTAKERLDDALVAQQTVDSAVGNKTELAKAAATARKLESVRGNLEAVTASLDDHGAALAALAAARQKVPAGLAAELAKAEKLKLLLRSAETETGQAAKLDQLRAAQAEQKRLQDKLKSLAEDTPAEEELRKRLLASQEVLQKQKVASAKQLRDAEKAIEKDLRAAEERLGSARESLSKGAGGMRGRASEFAATVTRRKIGQGLATAVGGSGRGPMFGDVRDMAAWETARAVTPRMVGLLESLFNPGVRAGAAEAGKRAVGGMLGAGKALGKAGAPTLKTKGASLFMSNDEFDAAKKDLESQDPRAYEQSVRAALINEPETIVNAVISAHLKQREFLFSKMPHDPALDRTPAGIPAIPVGPAWKPSPAEVEKFGRYARAASHWKNVVEDLIDRRATPEHMETLRAVYPEVAEALKGYVTRSVREMRARGKSYGTDEARMVDLVLGPPYQMAGNLHIFQSSFKQQERVQPSKGMGSTAIHISDNMQDQLTQRFGR